MPSSPQMSQSFSFPGYSFSSQEAAVTITGVVTRERTVAANSTLNSGTMTNKTDANTGVVTLQTGHTIVTSGVLVDVYFAAGMRYGMTATKSVNEITLEGGTGTDLPENATAVIVCAQEEFEINFDGDNALAIGVFYRNASDTGALGHVDFQDTGSSSIEAINLVHETANGGVKKGTNCWNISGGDTNVFSGNRITKMFVSHDSTSAGTIYVLVGQ